jgi:hypothetical protein
MTALVTSLDDTPVPAPVVPDQVELAQLHATRADTGDPVLVLGLAAGGVPVTVDLEDTSAHGLLSAGAGAGTSCLMRALAARCLAQGNRVIIIDFTRISR